MDNTHTAAAPVVVKLRERGEAVVRPDKSWKPYPCLLTRRELQELIANQLG
ncbi:hypothetical protein [Rhizobium sullae]|uniref:Uncharacterized protein n=1 Tax=Rhizobium sullae TaxID=50338 RepID=A0ABY5XUA1_RHISU|nr:hypothetical protein [Rhizobium sullae]UWU18215.1 hypothetical protein N2599_23395 [Rhizobium sullae]